MNLANKLTMSRIALSLVIIVLLLFPFEQIGFNFPSLVLDGRIMMDTKYLIVGIIFIIASLTDYFDGIVARKYSMITDFGKTIDAISDKILTNSLIIILACQGMVSPVIAVVIVIRDIVVDSLKMIMGTKKGAVGAIMVAKWKTATLMIGLTLTLFYDLPFSLLGVTISDYILIVAAVLSIISGVEYYKMASSCFETK